MEYKVQTPCGMIRGTAGRVAGTAAYKGIRYATAGRWAYPVQVTAWDGVYDATQYGKCCYQPRAFYDESKRGKAFYYHEFREGEHYDYSEDCLFLNVFAPDAVREGDDLPVIVYIHGGSFVGGCGHEKHFNGPVWPAKGVIGVTINYRLGPLGFACLPQLKEEAGTTGNYGLYDQVTAICWVRDNIRSFGGNPENITIMGQSAGAMSVQQLCQSPLTDGLFQKAVLSSGGGQDEKFAPESMESRFAFWQAVMKNAGCDTLDSFRALPVETLFEAWMKTGKEIPSGPPSPVCDGKLIIECKGKPRKAIPIMAGSTSEDMMPDLLHRMVIDWCAAQSVPAYAWYFDRQLPGDDDEDGPAAHPAHRHKPGHGGDHQQLPHQGVHEPAKIRNLIVMPGHIPVHKVRNAGQDEHGQGGQQVAGEIQIEQDDEHGDEHHPDHGQLVRGIHASASSLSMTPMSSPS